MREYDYPFAAIVGQERAKRALLLNLINPAIGGVLLCGEKGTAKSTIVRAAGRLGSRKVIDLPLNVTEDMLIGAVDFETAVKEGKRTLSDGVLKKADGNILYVDEINLLSDSIAASVVCAASSGENIVEREGISDRHSSRFILVGTMNPEEGGLRPQLLDKFGLYVNIGGEADVEMRAEIIRRRMAYERDPRAFCEAYGQETQKLQEQLKKAEAIFADRDLSNEKGGGTIRKIAARLAKDACAEGNRAELLLMETALAAAALDGRKYASVQDVKEAAEYVLPHRRREAGPQDQAETEQNQDQNGSPDEPGDQNQGDSSLAAQDNGQDGEDSGDGDEIDAEYSPDQETSGADQTSAPEEDLVEGEEMYQIVSLAAGSRRDRMARKGTGHRQKTGSSTNKGRYVGFSRTKQDGRTDVALDATLRAAAPYQAGREKKGCAVAVLDGDIRYKKRENHVGATIVFVVDASGSMGAKKRMKETKEAVLSMLMASYQKRDKIGLVAFRQKTAEVLLGITSSVELAQKELQSLPTGGRTPLADGLYTAWQLLRARRRKDPEMLPMIVLVTDGRANSGLWSDDPVEDALKAASLIANDHISSVVVDTENDFLSFQLARQIANALHAGYFKVDELKSAQLQGIVSWQQEESRKRTAEGRMGI